MERDWLSVVVSNKIQPTVKPDLTDTHIIRTPHYYGQFALFLGEKSPYIFSKFNPLNTDNPLIWKLSMVPSVSVCTSLTPSEQNH